MEDKAIINLIKMKNSYGLEGLIEKYKGLSYSVAVSILGSSNMDDVLECVNDAFYDIWRSFSNYDSEKSSLKGWVALVTRRRAIDMLRKNYNNKPFPIEDFSRETISSASGPEEAVLSQEHITLLNNFVKNLPETDRTIFMRRFFSLESINSIGQHLGLSRAAVDNRLSRMRKTLNEYFERSEAES